jgi:hypothetical protein
MQVLQPRHECRFGLLPVRSPLLRESLLISTPAGTEMFHFPAFALSDLCIQSGVTEKFRRVAPFGHPRIKGCLRLPEDFRSLPRPSSPDGS